MDKNSIIIHFSLCFGGIFLLLHHPTKLLSSSKCNLGHFLWWSTGDTRRNRMCSLYFSDSNLFWFFVLRKIIAPLLFFSGLRKKEIYFWNLKCAQWHHSKLLACSRYWKSHKLSNKITVVSPVSDPVGFFVPL